MSRKFSERHGYIGPGPEIVVREDAPEDLRYAVAQIARAAGLTPTRIRDLVCQVLLVAPNQNNWTDYPNIWDEVLKRLGECDWFKVYDIAETIWRSLDHDFEKQGIFEEELNRCFREKGIGWELKSPEGIVFRGGEAFSQATADAFHVLHESGRATAAAEIHEALADISRRPLPDRTGAVQHAIAAMECVARDVIGDSNTLGKLIAKLNLPRPLDVGIEKIWGFASERARHLREGAAVDDSEAELIVSVSCAVCSYLVSRKKSET